MQFDSRRQQHLASLFAQQLGEKLRCRCHSVLVQLCRCGKLARRKLGGSHIYLSADPSIQAGQLEVLARRNQPSGQVPAEIAVFILAEFIRCPDFGFEQLAETVACSRGIALKVEQIEALFALHGLKKQPGLQCPSLTGLKPLAGANGTGDIARSALQLPTGCPVHSRS